MKIFLYVAGYGLFQAILLALLIHFVTKQKKGRGFWTAVLKAVLYGFGIKYFMERLLSQFILCFCGYLFGACVFTVFHFLYISFVRGKEKRILGAFWSLLCFLPKTAVGIFKKAAHKRV